MLEDTFDIRTEQTGSPQEREYENTLRPLRFDDFAGQKKVVDNLRVFVEAARRRGEPLTIRCCMVLQDWEKLLFQIL